MNVTIRFASQEDLPTLVAIYNQAIRAGNVTADMDELSISDRMTWFNKYSDNTHPLYVAQVEEEVVGYCSLSPYRPHRRAMQKVVEVSYYVDYAYHGRGIGTQLLKHAIQDCPRINKKHLLAILFDINETSIGLLKKMNFRLWGHFPNIVNLEDQICGHAVYGLSLK